MSDLSINEIANRIVDAVLNEPNFSKEKLKNVITPILRIWVKRAQSPKSAKAYENALRNEMAKNLESKLSFKEKCKNKYIKPLEKCNKERNYYRNELIKIYGYNGIEAIDKQIELIS